MTPLKGHVMHVVVNLAGGGVEPCTSFLGPQPSPSLPSSSTALSQSLLLLVASVLPCPGDVPPASDLLDLAAALYLAAASPPSPEEEELLRDISR